MEIPLHVLRILSSPKGFSLKSCSFLLYSSLVPRLLISNPMIVETSPLVISKVNHPSVWIDHYGLMRSEINGIESWHGIVPRKPGRNPSAYYGRTSKVDVASRLPADPLVSDFAQPAKTRHAPVFLPEFRFDAFLREELQVLHGRCTKGLSIPRYLSRGRRDSTHLCAMVFLLFVDSSN